jgi:hypothetical protein
MFFFYSWKLVDESELENRDKMDKPAFVPSFEQEIIGTTMGKHHNINGFAMTKAKGSRCSIVTIIQC